MASKQQNIPWRDLTIAEFTQEGELVAIPDDSPTYIEKLREFRDTSSMSDYYFMPLDDEEEQANLDEAYDFGPHDSSQVNWDGFPTEEANDEAAD